MYLIRKVGNKQAAHLWLGDDTVCRMWSTGGLSKKRYRICATDEGRRLCRMCKINFRKWGLSNEGRLGTLS